MVRRHPTGEATRPPYLLILDRRPLRSFQNQSNERIMNGKEASLHLVQLLIFFHLDKNDSIVLVRPHKIRERETDEEDKIGSDLANRHRFQTPRHQDDRNVIRLPSTSK